MKHRLAGSTDVTEYFNLELAADGAPATGLTITGLDLQYVRSGAAPSAKVDATALAATDSAHGDNQAIEIDATDQPGLYRVDWPDAAFASGVNEVVLTVVGATIRPSHLRVNLTPVPSDLRQISGDGQSQIDLKDFADAGYDPSTNKVQGVVLVDTLTTYTGNTPQTADHTAAIAAVKSDTAATLLDTGTDGVVVAAASKTGYSLTATTGLGNQTADITGNLSGSVGSVTAGVTLANDAITAAKFDETTAFPLASADSGSTQVARTGADGDTLETLSDQIDGISGGANPNMLLGAEVAAVNSQTEFTLATGATFDDAYDNQTIVLYDDSNNDYPSIRVVTGYVGATKTITINGAPDFTLGTDDSVRIFATAPGATAPTVEQIRAEIDSNSTQLAAIVADTNELQTNQGNWLTATGFATATEMAKVPKSDSNVTWNATALASINAECDTALTDYAGATAAALASLVTTVGVAGAGLTEAGGDGDHLTAINLPNQTMDIVGNITGNLSGSVGSVTGAVGSVTGNVGGNVAGSVGSVTAPVTAGTVTDKTGYALSATGMNLVVPADPSAIPVPGTATLVTWIGWFGAQSVNEWQSDADEARLRNTANNADLATYPHADDGTTYSSDPAE